MDWEKLADSQCAKFAILSMMLPYDSRYDSQYDSLDMNFI